MKASRSQGASGGSPQAAFHAAAAPEGGKHHGTAQAAWLMESMCYHEVKVRIFAAPSAPCIEGFVVRDQPMTSLRDGRSLSR